MLIIAGVFLTLGLVVLMNLEPPKNAIKTKTTGTDAASAPSEAAAPPVAAPTETPESKPSEASRGAVVTVQPLGAPAATDAETTAPAAAAANPVTEADTTSLKLKNLLIPVEGVTANQLRDTFYDGRSEGRQHQALDIMAAGGTPVLAAADGKVARLFQSEKGGITLYQLDSSGLYYYYYAHLQRYADGVVEGKELKRGDVIAYVGDTGNAGAGNFHLHFAITKPNAPGHWSGGAPINPYLILTNK
ncbi:MAG TPA: M23 family metallopeptidase [Blastocatellia bacterium]|nr:M23 family metallopeptidase [Blastocatellia bacterium]